MLPSIQCAVCRDEPQDRKDKKMKYIFAISNGLIEMLLKKCHADAQPQTQESRQPQIERIIRGDGFEGNGSRIDDPDVTGIQTRRDARILQPFLQAVVQRLVAVDVPAED